MSTIVAISTAPGIGGIGIIRISGEESFSILKKMFEPKQPMDWNHIEGYTMRYGHIIEQEEIIDEVVVSFFRKGRSYTMEDVCEINSHGGSYTMQKILEICLKNGSELAEPGEFTKRAFLNGRIDLSQAEAVIDVIQAKTKKEAKSSLHQLEGYLSNQIQKIREKLMELMVQVEVSIDYPEYDVEEVNKKKAIEILEQVESDLIKLRNSFQNGKIIKEGIKIALIGKPNAGKSSLLNAILKEDRAIVTEMEGTTRDTIEEAVIIEGIPVHIIDTAGIRAATNMVEQIGIEKSKKMAEEADLVIAIFDRTRKLEKEDKEILELLKNKKSIILLNKIDKKETKVTKEDFTETRNIIEISAKEGIGIERIYQTIVQMFRLNEIKLDNDVLISNIRHKNNIEKAWEQTKEALKNINEELPIDIIAIYLKNIMEELGNITGENVSEDIIKEIFAKFCLGK